MWEDDVSMTEDEARAVIRTPGYPNVRKVLEAFDVAYRILGQDATLKEIYKWAEETKES